MNPRPPVRRSPIPLYIALLGLLLAFDLAGSVSTPSQLNTPPSMPPSAHSQAPSLNLYRVTLRGFGRAFIAGVDHKVSYVIAPDPTAAYGLVHDYLTAMDVGDYDDRQLHSVKLVAGPQTQNGLYLTMLAGFSGGGMHSEPQHGGQHGGQQGDGGYSGPGAQDGGQHDGDPEGGDQ